RLKDGRHFAEGHLNPAVTGLNHVSAGRGEDDDHENNNSDTDEFGKGLSSHGSNLEGFYKGPITKLSLVHTPMSSFHNSGRAAIKSRINRMHSTSCNTCTSIPCERTYSSGPRKVVFSPMTIRGIL